MLKTVTTCLVVLSLSACCERWDYGDGKGPDRSSSCQLSRSLATMGAGGIKSTVGSYTSPYTGKTTVLKCDSYNNCTSHTY